MASIRKPSTASAGKPPVSLLSSLSIPALASASSTSPSRRHPGSYSSQSTSPTSPRLSPRVQLIPHARTASYDISLSERERELLSNTNFDELDLSSQDFDFEDIFTYDKPQKKLTRVVEVSTPSKDRDWSNFSFSHYSAAVNSRNKVNSHRAKNGGGSGIAEKYLKKQVVRKY